MTAAPWRATDARGVADGCPPRADRGGRTSRRGVLAAALSVAFALRAAPASAAERDTALLAVLVGYEQATLLAYDAALASADLAHDERAAITRLRREAADAAGAARDLLVREGGEPPERRPHAEDPASAGHDRRLRAIIAAETRSVSGCYLALQAIEKRKLLAGAAALMTQAGRRLVELRELAGDPPLARAFETGGL